MRYFISIILFLLTLGPVAKAQEIIAQNKGVFEFSYANDVTGMNDKYYTNGVGFSLTLPVFEMSPFNPHWLKNSNYSAAYHTVNLQYNVFTPDLKAELFTDRPFAATVMLGSKHQYVFANKHLRLTSELKMGIIGQATGAGQLQNGLHELFPGAERVEGWETQIRNDLAINYIFSLEKQFQPHRNVEIITASSLFLGLPYTKVEPEIAVRLGLFNDYFDYLNNSAGRNWQAYFVTGAGASVIAYNATLQGGLFNPNNPYVMEDINHFVANYFFGLGLGYRNSSLIFSQTFITPEFSDGTSHNWGELQLIFRF